MAQIRQLNRVPGLRKNEVIEKDDLGFIYWNHHKNRNPMTYRCRLYKSVTKLLRESPDIYIDGTFDAAPLFGQQCQQMLVIMAKSFGYGFPIVFALMSRKTTAAYNKIISFLKQLEPAWNPNTVMSDFERAIIRSFEEHFQEDFFMYYRRFWINEIGPVTLSEHGRTDRTNNILEASHRNLMSHFTHSNPSPWSFVERLLPYIGAITKDIRRARDGIEIHRDQPVIWQQQNNKILRAQRQLGMGQLTIFEFLVRCIHTTPQFGVPAPIQNDEHDIPEVVNHENNAADLQIDNQDFGSDDDDDDFDTSDVEPNDIDDMIRDIDDN